MSKPLRTWGVTSEFGWAYLITVRGLQPLQENSWSSLLRRRPFSKVLRLLPENSYAALRWLMSLGMTAPKGSRFHVYRRKEHTQWMGHSNNIGLARGAFECLIALPFVSAGKSSHWRPLRCKRRLVMSSHKNARFRSRSFGHNKLVSFSVDTRVIRATSWQREKGVHDAPGWHLTLKWLMTLAEPRHEQGRSLRLFESWRSAFACPTWRPMQPYTYQPNTSGTWYPFVGFAGLNALGAILLHMDARKG